MQTNSSVAFVQVYFVCFEVFQKVFHFSPEGISLQVYFTFHFYNFRTKSFYIFNLQSFGVRMVSMFFRVPVRTWFLK